MTKIIHMNPETNEYYEIVPYPTAGGWLQGRVNVTHADLMSAFGPPTCLNGDKTQCEWDLKINGIMVMIYDYKEYGKPVQRIRNWHIGGTVPDAVDLVQGALEAWRSSAKSH